MVSSHERTIDGKVFYINECKHSFKNGRLYKEEGYNPVLITDLIDIENISLSFTKREIFLKNERCILELTDKKFNYIIRDNNGRLFLTDKEPLKVNNKWDLKNIEFVEDLDLFLKEF